VGSRLGAETQHVSFVCGPRRYHQILERLKANGVTINAGSLLVIPPAIHSFYFFDPNGIRLEITSDLDGDEEDLQVIRSCSMTETDESGLTLMAVALFHGSMSRSRAAATSAPAKFGIRPCGGNGKRATPSALSLSQTHCRAALLSAKSRAMTESGAARPGDSQGRNLLHEKPRGDPRLADVSAQVPQKNETSAPRDRSRGIVGRPCRHAAFADAGTDLGCDPVGHAPRCGVSLLAAAASGSIASYRLLRCEINTVASPAGRPIDLDQ
jgi:hypothetical protein